MGLFVVVVLVSQESLRNVTALSVVKDADINEALEFQLHCKSQNTSHTVTSGQSGDTIPLPLACHTHTHIPHTADPIVLLPMEPLS